MRRLVVLVVLVVTIALAACAGAEGPAGPAGPQGPAGLQGLPGPAGTNGSGTFYRVSAVVTASGDATVALPAAAGTSASGPPPLMSCYLSDGFTPVVWLAVTDGNSTTSAVCGLVFGGGVWNAVMSRAPVGWIAAFIVNY